MKPNVYIVFGAIVLAVSVICDEGPSSEKFDLSVIVFTSADSFASLRLCVLSLSRELDRLTIPWELRVVPTIELTSWSAQYDALLLSLDSTPARILRCETGRYSATANCAAAKVRN